jgi:hypothetical protein
VNKIDRHRKNKSTINKQNPDLSVVNSSRLAFLKSESQRSHDEQRNKTMESQQISFMFQENGKNPFIAVSGKSNANMH